MTEERPDGTDGHEDRSSSDPDRGRHAAPDAQGSDTGGERGSDAHGERGSGAASGPSSGVAGSSANRAPASAAGPTSSEDGQSGHGSDEADSADDAQRHADSGGARARPGAGAQRFGADPAPVRHPSPPTASTATTGNPAPNEAPTLRQRPAVEVDGPEPVRPRPAAGSGELAGIARRVGRLIASILRVIGYLLVLLLVVHIALRLLGASPDNGVVQVVRRLAEDVVLAFRDLFLPVDAPVPFAVNYGLAAVFWLVVTQLAARLARVVTRAR